MQDDHESLTDKPCQRDDAAADPREAFDDDALDGLDDGALLALALARGFRVVGARTRRFMWGVEVR